MSTVHLTVNGKPYEAEVGPQTSLLSVLREQLDLTGSKYGCGEGQCGACTVLIDGKRNAPASPRPAPSPRNKSQPSKVWPTASNCIPCKKRFSRLAPCSADIAPRE